MKTSEQVSSEERRDEVREAGSQCGQGGVAESGSFTSEVSISKQPFTTSFLGWMRGEERRRTRGKERKGKETG